MPRKGSKLIRGALIRRLQPPALPPLCDDLFILSGTSERLSGYWANEHGGDRRAGRQQGTGGGRGKLVEQSRLNAGPLAGPLHPHALLGSCCIGKHPRAPPFPFPSPSPIGCVIKGSPLLCFFHALALLWVDRQCPLRSLVGFRGHPTHQPPWPSSTPPARRASRPSQNADGVSPLAHSKQAIIDHIECRLRASIQWGSKTWLSRRPASMLAFR